MSFTDLTFLFVFLPVALLLYYMAKEEFKEIVLLLFSLLFYACGSAEYFGLLVIFLIINICLGKLIAVSRQKRTLALVFLAAGIVLNLTILGYYKYFDSVTDTVNKMLQASFEAKDTLINQPTHKTWQSLMPLGLSFYVFKAISYLTDTFLGKIEKNSILTAALYLSFFGQIQSGPVARYKTFEILGGAKSTCI